MKHKLLIVTFVSSLVLALAGCLQSPILNHANASLREDGEKVEKKFACPMLFSKEKFCASLSWVKVPTEDDKGQFTLRLWNQEQATENGPYSSPVNTVFVKLWMPSMGHGSSPTTATQVKDSGGVLVPGVFDVTNVYFVMPGAWQILVQLKRDGQVIDQAIQDVKI